MCPTVTNEHSAKGYVPAFRDRALRGLRRWLPPGMLLTVYALVAYSFTIGPGRLRDNGVVVMTVVLGLALLYAILMMYERMPPRLVVARGGRIVLPRPVRLEPSSRKVSSVETDLVRRVEMVSVRDQSAIRITLSDGSSLAIMRSDLSAGAEDFLRSLEGGN